MSPEQKKENMYSENEILDRKRENAYLAFYNVISSNEESFCSSPSCLACNKIDVIDTVGLV